MKRKGHIFEQIVCPDNLRLAFWKAQKGKSCKKDIIEFRKNLDANLLLLRKQLLDGTHRCGNYHFFTIYDPKQRVICAADFSERVLHHAIMNICSIDFENRQMPFSYACRNGKGTFAAIKHAACYQKNFNWYLKLDIRKYFDTIDHNILFSQLELMYKDKQFLNLLWQIIDSYHAQDGKGVPIGNLTSQYFANHYLSFGDKYLVEKLRLLKCIRYMDDILLWSNNREELIEKGLLFEHFLNNTLLLELKPFIHNKSQHGMPALGFMIYPTQIMLNKRSKNRFASKLERNENLRITDKISEFMYSQSVLSLYGFISYANHKGFARSVIKKLQKGNSVESASRVLRGGSWNNNATNVRVSNRNNNTPSNRNNNNGLRLACSSKQQTDFEQTLISFP
ncbi:MAG: RNA-directed DNA polymerase [Marinilabiliaceae bacterium]|nr:RNA-directed DNA polymerase [Marinilabiliaceae bacterium]